jgi:uncharacterized protein
MPQLGKVNDLVIVRSSPHGFYLDAGSLGEVLLPTGEIPPEVEQGDVVPVFLSTDSEDRLLATTTVPSCQVEDFAAMEVVQVHPRLGAFLRWGLPKDLLLPFAEQSRRVRVGDRVVVRVIVDASSGRLIATSKLGRYLDKIHPRYEPGQPVSLLILDRTPLGFAAMIDQQHRGLLPQGEVHQPLQPGDQIQGYVRAIREDYKVDLTLAQPGFGRITSLADQIIERLNQSGGRIDIGDQSSPEAIRAAFGTSKKSFKQAAGHLYKQRLITLSPHAISLADPAPN